MIDAFDDGRHFAVFRSDPISRIVRGQPDLHTIIRVAPIGMMVRLFGNQCHLGHEGKGLHEIIKLK